ncbi:Pre-mRNA splicing factor-domain-containing protein [Massariosphaeria phaeospora]|uniref:Pre-mRNA splicing factor-domain-containing protein n=1 Tax=Massariosphaeria phaeospora TaxID=100035 RepID=A0A7C8M750_9PLEO|nr:Pre-mRNA splicing factor-domain-containing protein [Massariosphaeria phaeospora]
MGGDLNLKKSWHTGLGKNRERVWKEEKAALEERKQIEKLRKEREEERQIEELQRLQEAAGGKAVSKRVEWMYSGPSADSGVVTEEREGYLLGKRRIDGLLKADTQSLQKGAAVGIDPLALDANSARDTKKKVLEDPLLIIQKQKMEMQIKAVKEAQKRAKQDDKRDKDRERDGGRHRDRNSDRHRDRESHRRDSDRYNDRESDRRHYHSDRRHRSRSPYHRERPSHNRYRERNSSDAGERLAAMQKDATTFELQRTQRVRDQDQKDAAEAEKRLQKGDSRLRINAGENMDLGDIMARGRQGYMAGV